MLAYSSSDIRNKTFPLLLEPPLTDAIFLLSAFFSDSIIFPPFVFTPFFPGVTTNSEFLFLFSLLSFLVLLHLYASLNRLFIVLHDFDLWVISSSMDNSQCWVKTVRCPRPKVWNRRRAFCRGMMCVFMQCRSWVRGELGWAGRAVEGCCLQSRW